MTLDLEEIKKWITELAEPLKKLKRAMAGQQIEDPVKLTEWSNLNERARLTQYQIDAIAFRRLVAQYGGREWAIMDDVANWKEHLSITKDGEQRREEILMTKARTEIPSTITSQTISVPTVETKPPEKKHFWSRKKEEPQKA